jgi:hypothetical protein
LVDLYTNGVLIGEVDITQPPSDSIAVPPAPVLLPGASPSLAQDYQNQINQLNASIGLLNGQLAQAKQNFTTSNVGLTDGYLGFMGFSQSGTTTCTFNNAWLFILLK